MAAAELEQSAAHPAAAGTVSGLQRRPQPRPQLLARHAHLCSCGAGTTDHASAAQQRAPVSQRPRCPAAQTAGHAICTTATGLDTWCIRWTSYQAPAAALTPGPQSKHDPGALNRYSRAKAQVFADRPGCAQGLLQAKLLGRRCPQQQSLRQTHGSCAAPGSPSADSQTGAVAAEVHRRTRTTQQRQEVSVMSMSLAESFHMNVR